MDQFSFRISGSSPYTHARRVFAYPPVFFDYPACREAGWRYANGAGGRISASRAAHEMAGVPLPQDAMILPHDHIARSPPQ